jgi:hypothetical protein
MNVRQTARSARDFAMTNVRELIFLLGWASMAIGLALVSVPAALIVSGALFIWLAIPPRSSGGKS